MGGIIVRGSDGEAMHQSLGRRSSQGMRDAREREVWLLGINIWLGWLA